MAILVVAMFGKYYATIAVHSDWLPIATRVVGNDIDCPIMSVVMTITARNIFAKGSYIRCVLLH